MSNLFILKFLRNMSANRTTAAYHNKYDVRSIKLVEIHEFALVLLLVIWEHEPTDVPFLVEVARGRVTWESTVMLRTYSWQCSTPDIGEGPLYNNSPRPCKKSPIRWHWHTSPGGLPARSHSIQHLFCCFSPRPVRFQTAFRYFVEFSLLKLLFIFL